MEICYNRPGKGIQGPTAKSPWGLRASLPVHNISPKFPRARRSVLEEKGGKHIPRKEAHMYEATEA